MCLWYGILVRQLNVSLELPATSKHRREMTERLLKATHNQKIKKKKKKTTPGLNGNDYILRAATLSNCSVSLLKRCLL